MAQRSSRPQSRDGLFGGAARGVHASAGGFRRVERGRSPCAGVPNPRRQSLLQRHSNGRRNGRTRRLRKSHRRERNRKDFRGAPHRSRSFQPNTGNNENHGNGKKKKTRKKKKK